jgi:hypothetical protein
VPYLPERRVQGRVNISDTLSSELCSEMYRNPGRIDYPTGRVAIFLLLPFALVLVCVKYSCIGSQVQVIVTIRLASYSEPLQLHLATT